MGLTCTLPEGSGGHRDDSILQLENLNSHGNNLCKICEDKEREKKCFVRLTSRNKLDRYLEGFCLFHEAQF